MSCETERFCALFVFLFSSYFIFCFFHSHPVYQGDSKKGGAGNVAAPQPPAIPVVVLTFLVYWEKSPYRHRLLVRSCWPPLLTRVKPFL
jgi:hypothetical protein